jgi:polyhydroxybutyrate depolymerase
VTVRERTFILICWLACLASSAYAQPEKTPTEPRSPAVEWVTREVQAPRVSFHTFDSASAKARVSYHLYTPAAYEGAAGNGFPVVYWLHGSGGGLAGIPQVARHFDAAIEAGKTPPCLVVFVNGLVEGMYVDWKDGTAPVETVIVKDLVPHIDGAYRTTATREGRMLDGFSMGGYGSARLGFKYPEMFRAVSIVGAGPMQAELIQAPRAGRKRAAEVLAKVYGGDQPYFRAVSPRTLAEQNAEAITKGSLVRVVIGDKDETFAPNEEFHEHLERLKVPHTWTVLPGVAHDPMGVLSAMGDDNWAFYRAAFGEPPAPAATSKPRATLTPGKAITRSIKVGTLDRRSLIYIPRGYDPARPTPVVVVFHGGGGNPESMVAFSGLNDKADDAGFIVVYPYGTGRLPNRLLTFNGGNCCGYAMDNTIDDVGFVRAMLDDLATVANVDANRVFATGMSNGGIMAYRVASELADRFAAIAPVGGPMGTETCNPSRPVAVMHFHGTADANAPFNGGQGVGHPLTNVRPVFLSVQHSLDQWIKANGCAPPPEVVQLPDAAADGMTVKRTTWGGGNDGAEVVLIEITGGGHTWPGRDPPLDRLGPSTKDISANDMMWEFFQRHAWKPENAPAAKPGADGAMTEPGQR